MSCYPDSWLVNEGADPSMADTLVLFAHGAGVDREHEFMTDIAEGLAAAGPRVVRFNFPYMERQRQDGRKRPPDRGSVLLDFFRQQVQLADTLLAPQHIILMGKSMGGRMATILAGEGDLSPAVKAVICLGYPFLPKGKQQPRLAPLQACALPLLIFQGERDSFGDRQQLQQWSLPAQLKLQFVSDGDHGFVPRKQSSVSLADNIASVVSGSLAFIRSHL